MRRFVARATAVVLLTTATTPGPALARTVNVPSGVTAGCSADAGQRSDAAAKWKEEAQRLPLGTKVKVKTTSGETVKGVLRSAGDTHVTIELTTRNPVPPVEVAYGEIRKLERQGMGLGTKIAIIAGVVGGAMLIVFAATFGCAGC